MFAEWQEGGHLRLFELEIGGNIIASRLAFVLGPDLYLYFSGYDPSWRKYGAAEDFEELSPRLRKNHPQAA